MRDDDSVREGVKSARVAAVVGCWIDDTREIFSWDEPFSSIMLLSFQEKVIVTRCTKCNDVFIHLSVTDLRSVHEGDYGSCMQGKKTLRSDKLPLRRRNSVKLSTTSLEYIRMPNTRKESLHAKYVGCLFVLRISTSMMLVVSWHQHQTFRTWIVHYFFSHRSYRPRCDHLGIDDSPLPLMLQSVM